MKRAEIVAEARRFVELKTPWKRVARHSEKGMNCGGIFALVARKFDVKFTDYDGDVRWPDGDLMKKRLGEACTPASVVNLKPGTYVLLHYRGTPFHCAIIGERDGHKTIIHVSVARRGAFEELLTPALMKKLHAAYDLPGVED